MPKKEKGSTCRRKSTFSNCERGAVGRRGAKSFSIQKKAIVIPLLGRVCPTRDIAAACNIHRHAFSPPGLRKPIMQRRIATKSADDGKRKQKTGGRKLGGGEGRSCTSTRGLFGNRFPKKFKKRPKCKLGKKRAGKPRTAFCQAKKKTRTQPVPKVNVLRLSGGVYRKNKVDRQCA